MTATAFQVVLVWVAFAEDHTKGKTRPAIVLQKEGELLQLIWATSQHVSQSCAQPWEFCVTDEREMKVMGHTKPARYSFRRGGVIVVKAQDIKRVTGYAPKSVLTRLVHAARNSI